MKASLIKAREMDPDCVQTYVGLVSLYGRPGHREMATENIRIGFEKVLKIYLDCC